MPKRRLRFARRQLELGIMHNFEFDTSQVSQEVKDVCEPLLLSDEKLMYVMKTMKKSIENGLGKETNDVSKVKCYPTYVQDMPVGTETGKFLALDLGGTNFRVLLIIMDRNDYFHMASKIYKIPVRIQLGKGTDLFDHIAKCLAKFIKNKKLNRTVKLPLGFTFSFPLRQVGLTEGYLITWTKGFNCTGVVGKDVVKLLKQAIAKRKDVNIDVCGILNDTTGTFMSCAAKNPSTKIGLIVGTGCNACYMEKVENVELFNGDKSKPHVIVNTEWGALGDDGTLNTVRTQYDFQLDKNSLNSGKQTFEKMISGMYMGEIVRLIMLDLAKRDKLFGGQQSTTMKKKGAFGSECISIIEKDKKSCVATCKVLIEMGIENPSMIDCLNVRYISECVSKRSAYLVSTGLAVLLNKMDEKLATIGVDGSVYRYHPYYKKVLFRKTRQLTNSDIMIKFTLSNDGSGRGAALVAAVIASNKQRELEEKKK